MDDAQLGGGDVRRRRLQGAAAELRAALPHQLHRRVLPHPARHRRPGGRCVEHRAIAGRPRADRGARQRGGGRGAGHRPRAHQDDGLRHERVLRGHGGRPLLGHAQLRRAGGLRSLPDGRALQHGGGGRARLGVGGRAGGRAARRSAGGASDIQERPGDRVRPRAHDRHRLPARGADLALAPARAGMGGAAPPDRPAGRRVPGARQPHGPGSRAPRRRHAHAASERPRDLLRRRARPGRRRPRGDRRRDPRRDRAQRGREDHAPQRHRRVRAADAGTGRCRGLARHGPLRQPGGRERPRRGRFRRRSSSVG